MPSLEALRSPRCYARCLQRLHAFNVTWETAIWRTEGVAPVIPDGALRIKHVLLARDLAALGAIAIEAAPLPEPALDCARALGALYVLEGASLGGRVIAKALADSAVPARARTYFTGYGERTGVMWKRFGRALGESSAALHAADDVVAGAMQCFVAFEAWLLATADSPEPAALAAR